MIDCELTCHTNSEQIHQIYAGFAELAAQGQVRLTAKREPCYVGKLISLALLSVRVNGRHSVIYDTIDTACIPEGIDFNAVDFYFKRSYQVDYVRTLPHREKIFPLGLGCLAYSRRDFLYRRALWAGSPREVFTQLCRANPLVARALKIKTSIYTSDYRLYEGEPRVSRSPKILFITRTWVPERVACRELYDQRQNINEMRVECIRRLRSEFGSRFTGGLMPGDYARKYYPELVLDAGQVYKRRYLETMHACEIGVTSVGLQESNSWKLAEYVAAAKAVVTETLNHQVPGDFKVGRNYLEFATPDECVAAVCELVDSPEKRWQMMVDNLDYYYHYLKPDALVWNSLMTVFRRDER